MELKEEKLMSKEENVLEKVMGQNKSKGQEKRGEVSKKKEKPGGTEAQTDPNAKRGFS